MFSLLINPGNAWLIVLHLKMFRPQHMRLIFWSRHFPSRLRREGFIKTVLSISHLSSSSDEFIWCGTIQTQRKDTVFCSISLALTGNYRHRGRNTKKSRRFACSWESELRAIVFFPTEMGPLRWFRWLFVSFIVGMQMRSFAFTQDEFVKAVRFAHLNVKCREVVQYCGLFACVVCLIT